METYHLGTDDVSPLSVYDVLVARRLPGSLKQTRGSRGLSWQPNDSAQFHLRHILWPRFILSSLILMQSSFCNPKTYLYSQSLAVNKLSLNTAKTKFMLFHNYQKTIDEDDIPHLTINDTIIERMTEFNFLGLTINEFMNWNSHASKISNKISRTLGVMNRLKRYLPLSAMKLMYCSLILSHLQFAITSWGFEWERLSKLQKRVIRIMTNK